MDSHRRATGGISVIIAAVVAIAAAMTPNQTAGAVPGGTTTPNCTAQAGQDFIEAGDLERAVRVFTCVIDAQPSEVEGYRGRIEAQLLLGRYSEAMRDYGRVTAFVLPVHPDAPSTIFAHYADRLAGAPDDIAALTGASFARWWDFQYPQTIKLTDALLAAQPNDVYATLFRGSSRLLHGVTKARGVADLERAIELAPTSPDVRWVVADAYAYGESDLARAFAEASLALDGGLDTPRVHAILAAALNEFGDLDAAASHIERHLDLVTTELVATSPLAVGDAMTVELVPGRTYAIPIVATAGETISISTSSHDYWDSIGLLRGPDGSAVVGGDDDIAYFAAIDWVAQDTGVHVLEVTFFESVNFGELVVTRS